MPRNGSGVYSLPAGYLAVTSETIEATQHNTPLEDLETDMNAARPIVAGGTGATTASAARDNLEIDGKVLSKSGNYTAVAGDRSKLIRCTATLTLSLTAAATLGNGWYVYVQAAGGTVTIDPDGSETIDGATTLSVPRGSDVIVICDGSEFFITGFLAEPVGSVIWFGANSPPSGWLECDGSTVSRTTYADLFSAIGTTFGSGDGSTTFEIPDLRGEFVRGWDNGKGTDSGRSFGSSQTDAFQGHYHDHTTLFGWSGGGSGGSYFPSGSRPVIGLDVFSPISDGSNGTPRTAAETRPTNIALLPIIKY